MSSTQRTENLPRVQRFLPMVIIALLVGPALAAGQSSAQVYEYVIDGPTKAKKPAPQLLDANEDTKVPILKKGEKVKVVLKNFNRLLYSSSVEFREASPSPFKPLSGGALSFGSSAQTLDPVKAVENWVKLAARYLDHDLMIVEKMIELEKAFQKSPSAQYPNLVEATRSLLSGLLENPADQITISSLKTFVEKAPLSTLETELSRLKSDAKLDYSSKTVHEQFKGKEALWASFNLKGSRFASLGPSGTKASLDRMVGLFEAIERIHQSGYRVEEVSPGLTAEDKILESDASVKLRNTITLPDGTVLSDLPIADPELLKTRSWDTIRVEGAKVKAATGTAAVFFSKTSDKSYGTIANPSNSSQLIIAEKGDRDSQGVYVGSIWHFAHEPKSAVNFSIGVGTNSSKLAYFAGISFKFGEGGYFSLGKVVSQVTRLDGVNLNEVFTGNVVPTKSVYRDAFGISLSFAIG